MRLLIATGLYPPEIGGPATYTVFLEKHLSRFGVEYEVLPYTSVRKYPRFVRHAVYFFLLMRRARHMRVLYALDTVSVGLPVYLASLFSRTPYMLRVPGDYAWEQGQARFEVKETLDEFSMHTNHPWQVRILSFIQRMVARNARHIIVPSEYMRKLVEMWGISPEKITRIYSTPKSIEVPELKEALRAEFGYANFVVLTACRLVPWKGVDALIDVVKALHNKDISISLEILGDGVCRKELEEKVARLNMGGIVSFRGNLDREEMGRRIKASNVFVLNTSYEGLSHQLIEVMALGTPVVTTPVGGNVELVTNHETGLLVPFNDAEEIASALMEIYAAPLQAESRAVRAQEKSAEFNEEKVIQEFVTVLKKVG